ncbi:hypothetical protein PoB_000218800 [Plakobranchus ocellatus]|uniref:Uncharacterized protein n=1 Tax=Plakobranchus ocellatus TaxID=259542 RepID=A0AAV3Y0A8_9GAST|nr:hypothetical protein PoB_000218800 [Plakobranchus ocellatus]
MDRVLPCDMTSLFSGLFRWLLVPRDAWLQTYQCKHDTVSPANTAPNWCFVCEYDRLSPCVVGLRLTEWFQQQSVEKDEAKDLVSDICFPINCCCHERPLEPYYPKRSRSLKLNGLCRINLLFATLFSPSQTIFHCSSTNPHAKFYPCHFAVRLTRLFVNMGK